MGRVCGTDDCAASTFHFSVELLTLRGNNSSKNKNDIDIQIQIYLYFDLDIHFNSYSLLWGVGA